MAVIQQHQLLIIHLNTLVCSTWTPQPNIQSRSQTSKLVHAASAKICLNSSPSAIRHKWFAGQGKSLYALAQAIHHQYMFTKPQVCSQSPLKTLSKIPPVSSSLDTRAVYKPKQDFMWSKCSETPCWFRNVVYNSIPLLSSADGRNAALSKHTTISNLSAMFC